MTPEEAAAWAADQPVAPSHKAELTGETCDACCQCKAPPYLDGYCADHWRLLIGYAGHARMREADSARDAADPIVQLLESWWNAI